MDFNGLLKKGEAALAGKDGKVDYKELGEDAQSAYKTYNSTEGTFQDKATAAYKGYQKEHEKDGKDEKKEEKK